MKKTLQIVCPFHILVAVVFCILAFTANISNAQVNTETLRLDSQKEGFIFTTDFSFGLSEGNVRYLNLLGNTRVDYQKGKNRSFAVVQYSRGVQEGDLYRNAGFLSLRNTYYVRPAVGLEVFAQQEFNEFILLRDRKLAGSGARLRLINYEADDADNKLQLIFGVGGMFEYEDINSIIQEQTSLIRSTNYISLIWDVTERVNINAVTYFQVALTDLSDYRNLLESSLEVKLAESLALTVAVNHRYDSSPPIGIEPYDIQVRNGLRLLF